MNPQVGAASTHVHDLLTGPPQAGLVRRVGRDRAAVEVAGRLIVLVRATGPQTLPCSVVVPRLDLAGVDGERALVGHQQLVVGDHRVEIVRWWDPPRVHPGARSVGPQPSGGPSVLDDDTLRALRDAATALVARDTTAAECLVQVLGRGRGSTPDADDAVAGLLLAGRRLADPDALRDVEAVGATVARAAPSRTTLLSAELLRAAAHGYAVPVLVQHLTSPTAHSAAEVERLGATSGRATLAGVRVLHRAWRRGAREAVTA
ncbi:DUF2877 domain-containing protein [Angustibacter sp. Root456]|uniref:oxamate carbamoyltransferase subunit AllH family protein n=1 Tax=Angustibacter sp. Root456 TaxID=1736539 RepID=UPI0012F7BE8B|nr:DUF2877 domain-containing protein [Angustibacter sp. Root456]